MTRISGIYHQANGPAPTGRDAQERNREAMREAWVTRGLAVFDLNDIVDDWSQQFVINLANSLYGKRRERK